jgi:hypothetical protein
MAPFNHSVIIFDEAIATARAEALRDAADRAIVICESFGMLKGDINDMRRAILAEKQEEPVDYRNTLFGYPVVVDASIPHDRLIIMTPAVFDDLKKHLESTMLDNQEGEK